MEESPALEKETSAGTLRVWIANHHWPVYYRVELAGKVLAESVATIALGTRSRPTPRHTDAFKTTPPIALTDTDMRRLDDARRAKARAAAERALAEHPELVPAILIDNGGYGNITLTWSAPTEEYTGELTGRLRIWAGVYDAPRIDLENPETTRAIRRSALPTLAAVTERPPARDIAVRGADYAIWPISRDEYAAIESEYRAYRIEAGERLRAVLTPKPRPPHIEEMFRRYRTSEAAWDAEDEEAWALMRDYE